MCGQGGKAAGPALVPQLLPALAVSMCAAVVGGWISFPSVAIPKMMCQTENLTNQSRRESGGCEDQQGFTVDLDSASWIASVFFIGNILGCLVGGSINSRLGCRLTFLGVATNINGGDKVHNLPP